MGLQRVRQKIDTEKLLQWAFRDELPKRQAVEQDERFPLPGYPTSSPMFALANLGVRIDSGRRDHDVPASLDAPHPDALVIEQAVLSLDDASIDWPSTRAIMLGYIAGLLGDHDPTLRNLKIDCVGLVGMHARLRTRPRWDLWSVPNSIISGKNGKVLVTLPDGTPAKSHGDRRGMPWYPEGSGCPLQWWPAPREAAFARIEYSIWWQAIDTLADYLRPLLESHEALPPAAYASPWIL